MKLVMRNEQVEHEQPQHMIWRILRDPGKGKTKRDGERKEKRREKEGEGKRKRREKRKRTERGRRESNKWQTPETTRMKSS